MGYGPSTSESNGLVTSLGANTSDVVSVSSDVDVEVETWDARLNRKVAQFKRRREKRKRRGLPLSPPKVHTPAHLSPHRANMIPLVPASIVPVPSPRARRSHRRSGLAATRAAIREMAYMYERELKLMAMIKDR
ncbi:hypothetical protein KIPB_009942 [Kipferlia bialata]|uniref:Uncharacterized protein n=1 Tax=Kipferlia bialata TaxID=797122 RepID=A0A9K3D309_9EUKA|nr:hypothetical protein KIPB_009942 [Kipferlia bialata]|eukprot:g9942.t1